MRSIGMVQSPYVETSQIPKGLGANHGAEGYLEVLPEFEAGLMDIDGFSHLFVIWLRICPALSCQKNSSKLSIIAKEKPTVETAGANDCLLYE